MEEEKLNKAGNRRGLNPNSRKNLDNGRSGNNHTKKDYSITRIVKEMLDQPAEERWLEVEDKGMTWRQAIAKRLLVEAVRGNAKVIADLQDRLEGKVTLPVASEGEITLRVRYDNS